MSVDIIRLTEADQEHFDDYLDEMGWGDGLPAVPPTAARVESMLAGTNLAADHELGVMPPRQGVATVERVAINAVMAGCRAEHLSVLIAAVEAVLEPAFNLFAVQATTHPCSPLLIVNGPVVDRLGINARYGAFGPGVRANATIGRALRLVLLNIGGAAAGILDRATQGAPSKYSFCVAENETESPWEPLHVERGFDPQSSTVTVVGCESPHNINDHVSLSADGILTTITGSLANMGSNNAYLHGGPVLALGPEHAAIIASEGLAKSDIRQHVFDHARIPRHIWERGGMAKMVDDPFSEDAFVPIVSRPDDLLIIVLGGFGRHSCWLPTFGESTKAVTKAVRD